MERTERLEEVLKNVVSEPRVKGSELAWVFRCRGCQTCLSNPSDRPHWIGLEEIPNTQLGDPLE